MSPKPQGVFQTMNLRQFFSLWDGVILSSKIYDMCGVTLPTPNCICFDVGVDFFKYLRWFQWGF